MIAVGNHSVNVPTFQWSGELVLEFWHMYGVISHSNYESAFLGHPVFPRVPGVTSILGSIDNSNKGSHHERKVQFF